MSSGSIPASTAARSAASSGSRPSSSSSPRSACARGAAGATCSTPWPVPRPPWPAGGCSSLARGRALLAGRQARRDRGALPAARRRMSGATALYRRLFVYLRPHVGALCLGTALAIVVAAMEGAIAWLVKPAMDDIFIRRDLTMLKVIPLLFLGAYLLKGAARYAQSYLMAAVGERVITKLRHDLYAHVQRLELSFFAHHHSADLMSRIVTDVNRLARLSSTVLVMTIRQIVMIVALATVMFVREWRLAL